MSLVALQKLIGRAVFVAVVVKDFPRMYEEDAVSKCLSRLIREIDHSKRQLYLLVEEISIRAQLSLYSHRLKIIA